MSKINDQDITKVNAGVQPEEFDWETKGYTTPVKEDNEKGWVFKAIGQAENIFKKIFNK